MSRSSSGLASPGEPQYDYSPSDQFFFEGGKRRISIGSHYGPGGEPDEFGIGQAARSKRARHSVSSDLVVDSIQPFYILREDSSSPAPLPRSVRSRHSGSHKSQHSQSQDSYFDHVHQRDHPSSTRPSSVDRSSKRNSACSENPQQQDGSEDCDDHMSDAAAADSVERHVAENHKRNRHSKHERILKSLIRPKARMTDFEIDDGAIDTILYAANEFFFCGRLKGRVAWEWSDKCHSRFQTNIIGTTALRKASDIGGYETLIILSSHFLRDKNYSRRLLISTFLHELVHSYMFICCGFKARASGGHTEGFVRIASFIDNWAGPETLHLKNIEADLDDFLAEAATYLHDQPSMTSYCSVHTSERPSSRDSPPTSSIEHRPPIATYWSYERRSASPDYTSMNAVAHNHQTAAFGERTTAPTFIVLPANRPEPRWHYEGPVDYRHNRLA